MDDDTAPAPARNRIWLFVPVMCFMALAVMFYVRLDDNGDPARLPSALLGRSIPVFTLPPLEGLLINGVPVPGFSDQDAKNADPKAGITAINIFASWCGPCRDEHPVLLMLALHLAGMRTEIMRRRVRTLSQQLARQDGGS